MDEADNVYISYMERYAGGKSLKYITNEDGPWEDVNLEDMEGGGFTSIDVDWRGNVHISYYVYEGDSQNWIKYIRKDCGYWVESERVVRTYASYKYNAIAMDSECNVNIIYLQKRMRKHHLYHAISRAETGDCQICPMHVFYNWETRW